MYIWLLRLLVIVAGTLLSSYLSLAIRINPVITSSQELLVVELQMRAVLIVAGFVAAWIPFPQKIRFNAWRAIVSVIVFGGLIFMGLPYKVIIFGLDWGGWLGKLTLMGWAIPVFVVWLGYELGQSLRAPEPEDKI